MISNKAPAGHRRLRLQWQQPLLKKCLFGKLTAGSGSVKPALAYQSKRYSIYNDMNESAYCFSSKGKGHLSG